MEAAALPQPFDQQKPDFQRFAFVIQADHRGRPTSTEWNARAGLHEIAQALTDNDLPDCIDDERHRRAMAAPL